jgi:hypothetical protein
MMRIDVLAPTFSDATGRATDNEADAQLIAIFSPGAEVAIAFERTRYGNLRIFGSDLLRITSRLNRSRWANLDAALRDLTTACGVWLATVDL